MWSSCRYRQKNVSLHTISQLFLPIDMDYISAKEYAHSHGISERTVRNYCARGRLPGAVLVGKTWSIPTDVRLPERINARTVVSPLLTALREQKAARIKGGIYHRTQIDLTYNSNHIEGSRLSKEQTRYIFETNTIGVTDVAVRVDDIIETHQPLSLHRLHHRSGNGTADRKYDKANSSYPEIRHIGCPKGLVCSRRIQALVQ